MFYLILYFIKKQTKIINSSNIKDFIILASYLELAFLVFSRLERIFDFYFAGEESSLKNRIFIELIIIFIFILIITLAFLKVLR